jgi:hypothetical protein
MNHAKSLNSQTHDNSRLQAKPADFELASLIHDFASMRQKKMGIGRTPTGELIDRLEKSQLIERRVDKKDRRIRKIYLTDKGEKISQTISKITKKSNKNMLADLSFIGVEHTSRTIKKLINHLAVFPNTNQSHKIDRRDQ